MPKGEIVGMFTGRMCLSLMERTTMKNKEAKMRPFNNNDNGKQE
jgi:hypothetical protein